MLTMQSDIEKAMRQLKAFSDKKQLEFAISTALNRTAVEVQQAVKTSMPRKFTLRSNWVVQGIRVEFSKKGKLESIIYSRDKFMGLQEYGGDKKPFGNYLAIPTTLVRRTPRDKIRRSETPKALGDKVEVVTVGRRRFLALKKRRKGRSGNMLRLMYMLIPHASIRKRLGLEEDGGRIARARFMAQLEKALEDAIRTAR